MKKWVFMSLYLLALLFLAPTSSCLAYDFSAVAPSGQTLYYNISNGTAMVTYEVNLWESGHSIRYTTFPSGELVIPDTVTNNGIAYPVTAIDWEAFYGCSGLTSVVIPNTVYYIGPSAFEGCSGVTSMTIPESATYITSAAFANCTGLTSIVLPNSMLTIASDLFSGCTNLTSVTIGSALTRIESYAFNDCVNLTSVYLLCNNPPQLYDYAFFSSSGTTPLPHTATFYVKCGSTSAYNTAWGAGYTFSENWIPYILNIGVSDPTMGSVFVEATACGQGILTATANYGYLFEGWEDGDTNNPRAVTLTHDTSFTAVFSLDPAVPHIDTIILHDTLYVYVHDSTYIVQTDTVTNTVYETIHDTITNTVYIDNYIHDTLTVTDTLWLTVTDTLWMHDTIIIHDTVYITQDGIDGVGALNAKVYSSQGQIIVEGADGNMVTLFDINGRMIAAKQDYGSPIRIDVPASGTYMIKIGNLAARKVVVIR